jgi:hypothetical protein
MNVCPAERDPTAAVDWMLILLVRQFFKPTHSPPEACFDELRVLELGHHDC